MIYIQQRGKIHVEEKSYTKAERQEFSKQVHFNRFILTDSF